MDTFLDSPKLIKDTIKKKSHLNYSINLLGQNHGDFYVGVGVIISGQITIRAGQGL